MTLNFFDNASFKYFAERDGYEEHEVLAFLSTVAHNPGSLVIDVGANYGAFTLPAASLAQLNLVDGVMAIEPDRRPFQALERSVKRNGFERVVEMHNVIVGDAQGSETIFVNSRSSADNRTHEVTSAPIRVRSSYDVRCTTVDDLVGERAKRHKLALKMDIQGNEPRAFRGMRESLKAAPGFALFFEHAPYLIESAGEEVEPYEELLVDLEPEKIYEFGEGDRLIELDGIDGWRESLAALKSRTSKQLQGVGSNYAFLRGMDDVGLRGRT